MGQTLSHGVYLPNEGERNCYAGLASNWQILNTAVGNIAEKAPLVHTHTVSQITDFPAYGNAAGTICEGNDSRLSDARTPLAHTHTKSDVTDLLNSNFIPSANNSYDLGSSSYQWNNLYAKNYYYNGTAWGLDKANVYSLEQTISATSGKSWNVKNTNYTLGENTPSSDKLVGAFAVQDNDNNNAFLFNLNHYSNGEVISRWLTRFKFTNGVKSTTGTQKAAVIEMGLTNSGDRFARPGTNKDMDLGTSTNKWKTLNGINPGALSLPNVRAAVADPISTVGWNLSGSRNKYTPTEDGWFYIRVAGAGSCVINIHNGGTDNSYPTWFNTSTDGYATLVVPCEKGISLYIYIFATSIEYCSFHPCLGNV